MRNVTVSLDDETARWARIEAARQDISVSSLIRGLLEERMAGQESYQAAFDRWAARTPEPISDGAPYPTRDELHDRAGLR